MGAGNMVSALWPSQLVESYDIDIYTPSYHSAEQFAKKFGGRAIREEQLRSSYDLLFLAHKPQQLGEVRDFLQRVDFCRAELISILASISISQLQEAFSTTKVLRLMPNTPVKVGAGVVTCFSHFFTEFQSIVELLSQNALILKLASEEELDDSTPITGSGPAFLFELARVWQLYLEQKGFDSSLAAKMVRETLYGSSCLLRESNRSFTTLRNEVTSKKGVTERGLDTLSTRDFEQIVLQSLNDARQRIEELKK